MSPSRRASASASTATDFVRIALVENEHRIRQAARNIKRFLAPERQAGQKVAAANAR